MNPIIQVYQALVEVSKQNPILRNHIKAGNYVAFDQKTAPKQNVSSADLPELVLGISNVFPEPIVSSSRTKLTVTYQWMLTAGTFDIEDVVGELLWGLFISSCSWCDELTKLQYEDRAFVSHVELPSADMLLTDADRNRGISGWSAGWPIVVEMSFDSKHIRNLQWRDR